MRRPDDPNPFGFFHVLEIHCCLSIDQLAVIGAEVIRSPASGVGFGPQLLQRMTGHLHGAVKRLTNNVVSTRAKERQCILPTPRPRDNFQLRVIVPSHFNDLLRLLRLIHRNNQQASFARPSAFQQIKTGCIAIERLEAKAPHELNLIRVVIEHGCLDPLAQQKPGDDTPYPPQTGDDDGVFFVRHVFIALRLTGA